MILSRAVTWVEQRNRSRRCRPARTLASSLIGDTHVWEWNKKKTGRDTDGRTWDEWPKHARSPVGLFGGEKLNQNEHLRTLGWVGGGCPSKLACLSDRILLQFSVMKGSVISTIAEAVDALDEQSFVRRSDFDAPRGPVDTALSRLCRAGILARVRQGLYWKGSPTPFGMSRPSTEDIALEVGGLGSGPAGVAAAHWLGLTTQVPATFVAAVPGRAPAGWPSVRFTQRSLGRRLRELRPSEVALIEVLRAGPTVLDSPWGSVESAIRSLVETGAIRLDVVDEQITEEPHQETRARWSELVGFTRSLAGATAG